MSKNGVVHGLDFLTAECVAPFRFCCYQSFILLPVWEGNLFEEKERGGLAVQILAGNLYPSHAAMHNGHKRTIFSVLVCHLPAVDWLHWLVIHGYPFLGVREAANGHDLLVDLMCIYNIYIQYIYMILCFPQFSESNTILSLVVNFPHRQPGQSFYKSQSREVPSLQISL